MDLYWQVPSHDRSGRKPCDNRWTFDRDPLTHTRVVIALSINLCYQFGWPHFKLLKEEIRNSSMCVERRKGWGWRRGIVCEQYFLLCLFFFYISIWMLLTSFREEQTPLTMLTPKLIFLINEIRNNFICEVIFTTQFPMPWPYTGTTVVEFVMEVVLVSEPETDDQIFRWEQLSSQHPTWTGCIYILLVSYVNSKFKKKFQGVKCSWKECV